jgi:hypothetical protein
MCIYCMEVHPSNIYCAQMYRQTADQLEVMDATAVGPVLRSHRAGFAADLRAAAEDGDTTPRHKVLTAVRWLYGLDRGVRGAH